jgi:3-oxoacyl-[acyl-carrier protein] reductase
MSTQNAKLAGKVAVVTGASKGIGANIAKHLAAAGASVIVNYASSKEGARRVVEEITGAGGRAAAIQADVSRAEDIERLFNETEAVFGKADILVNNAGVFEFLPLEAVTEEHYHKQFNLNVLGLILATRKAAEHFGDRGGVVINISSVIAYAAIPGSVVYSATKGAVEAITRSLAAELGPKKIRVNSLNPGMIETEGVHAAGFIGGDFHTKIGNDTPLGRVGQPDDIGPVAVFLASDDSAWVSGEFIRVAGGLNV